MSTNIDPTDSIDVAFNRLARELQPRVVISVSDSHVRIVQPDTDIATVHPSRGSALSALALIAVGMGYTIDQVRAIIQYSPEKLPPMISNQDRIVIGQVRGAR